MDKNQLSAGALLGGRFVIVEPSRSEKSGVYFTVYDMMQLEHTEVVVPWNERGDLDPSRFALRAPTGGPPVPKPAPRRTASAAASATPSWSSGAPRTPPPAEPRPRAELPPVETILPAMPQRRAEQPPAEMILPPVRVLPLSSLQTNTRNVILTPVQGTSTKNGILPPVLRYSTQRALLPSPLSTIRLNESDLHMLGMIEPATPTPSAEPSEPGSVLSDTAPATSVPALPAPVCTEDPAPSAASLPLRELTEIERRFKQLLGRRAIFVGGALLACCGLVFVGWLLGRRDVGPPPHQRTAVSAPERVQTPTSPTPARVHKRPVQPAPAPAQTRPVQPPTVDERDTPPRPAAVRRHANKRTRRTRRSRRRRAVDADAILASAVTTRRGRRGRVFRGTVDPFRE